MFGKKTRKKDGVGNKCPVSHDQASADDESGEIKDTQRIHNEALGHVWLALTGLHPKGLIPQVVSTVLHEGGTRRAWQWTHGGMEYIFMAWPQDQPLRAGVLMEGPEHGKLNPVTVTPLLEGMPNDLMVDQIHARQEGMGGDVAVSMLEGKKPMWFFDPLYGRDKDDLSPGVTHTFWLGAVALGLRRAFLDEVSIAQGPQFEAYVEEWLRNNPGKSRMDAPPLKIDIRGKAFIMPGRFFGEYQLRATVEKVEDCVFEKMPVKIVYLTFPFDDRPDMRLPLYASKNVLGEYEPEEGHEIEAYAWFQGRIIDLETPDTMAEAEGQ